MADHLNIDILFGAPSIGLLIASLFVIRLMFLLTLMPWTSIACQELSLCRRSFTTAHIPKILSHSRLLLHSYGSCRTNRSGISASFNITCQAARPCPSRRNNPFRLLPYYHALGWVPTRMNENTPHTSHLLSSGDISVLNRLTWSWAFELLLNTLIMFTCQIFLTYRFKIISDGNWWITSVLVFFAVVQLVIGVFSGATAILLSNKGFPASTATGL
jgi:hypothetical protein